MGWCIKAVGMYGTDLGVSMGWAGLGRFGHSCRAFDGSADI